MAYDYAIYRESICAMAARVVYFLSALLGAVWISQLHYIYENKAQGTGGREAL